MKVLIVGSGAREHALAWRINQSPLLTRLWVAGGNAGTAALGTNLGIRSSDMDAMTAAAQEIAADLVVVGPEAPLAAGLADKLAAMGIPVFGPSAAAARIEASKSFALEVMREASVPSPEFHVFDDETAALDHLRANSGPVVVKADGLAAGKGVILCPDSATASAAVRECMSDRLYGDAGETVVLQEYLSGPEVSVFAFCDGEHIAPLVAACDYKRLDDRDQGPNTGGMGSFAPPDFWTPEMAAEIERTVMRPVVAEMARRGAPYRGVLYAGLILTSDGPKVLEFNCRLGDPETQVIMPLLASDPLELMLACYEGGLDRLDVRWDSKHYVGVVMASGGYPESFQTGFEVSGLDRGGNAPEPTMVFQAGTTIGPGGANAVPVTSGGRVLTVVGGGATMAEARQRAYVRLKEIAFEAAVWRSDIGSPVNRSGVWQPAQKAHRPTTAG